RVDPARLGARRRGDPDRRRLAACWDQQQCPRGRPPVGRAVGYGRPQRHPDYRHVGRRRRRMDRMSAMDAMFYYMEDENTPMHVGGVAVLEGPPPAYGDIVRLLADRKSV